MSDHCCLHLTILKTSFQVKRQIKNSFDFGIHRDQCFIYSDPVWLEVNGRIDILCFVALVLNGIFCLVFSFE